MLPHSLQLSFPKQQKHITNTLIETLIGCTVGSVGWGCPT